MLALTKEMSGADRSQRNHNADFRAISVVEHRIHRIPLSRTQQWKQVITPAEELPYALGDRIRDMGRNTLPGVKSRQCMNLTYFQLTEDWLQRAANLNRIVKPSCQTLSISRKAFATNSAVDTAP